MKFFSIPFGRIVDAGDDVVMQAVDAAGMTAGAGPTLQVSTAGGVFTCRHVDASNYAVNLLAVSAGLPIGTVAEVYAVGGPITVFPIATGGGPFDTFLDGSSSKIVNAGMRFTLVADPNVGLKWAFLD